MIKHQYQQKHFCSIFRESKQRVEYRIRKAQIKPIIEARGTGTTNIFDFSAVFSFGIAKYMSSWGFEFRAIVVITNEIKSSEPDLFKPMDFSEIKKVSKDRNYPPTEEHILLYNKVPGVMYLTSTLDDPNPKPDLVIGKAKDIFIDSGIKEIVEDSWLGSFIINLTKLRIHIHEMIESPF